MYTERNAEMETLVDMKVFMEDYSRGMKMLSLHSRAFATLAAGIGYPIANPNISTAQVSVDIESKKIAFEVNPDFIHKLKDSEVAAVIAHETYHVLLNHLGDLADTKNYPKTGALIKAQECIINDGLPGNVGFTTPKGTLRGEELYNQDFSYFSTREGYDFIVAFEEENAENKDSPEKSEQQGQTDSTQNNGAPEDSEQQCENSASGNSSGSDEEQPEEEHGMCSGPAIKGGDDLSEEELEKQVKEILKDGLNKAVEEMSSAGEIPEPELSNILEELEETLDINPSKNGNVGSPNKNAFSTLPSSSGMNLNWVNLLAKINPKIKSSGRSKSSESWVSPNRRMISSYPRVILPSSPPQPDPNNKKGTSVPSLIVALDMSVSIPETLCITLANLATSIPEKLIKAFPITWSDTWKEFDPANPRVIVRRNGTNIHSVYQYAETVKKETGIEPYVLVLTDGGFTLPHTSSMPTDILARKWFWMALQAPDQKKLKSVLKSVPNVKDKIFYLEDFI